MLTNKIGRTPFVSLKSPSTEGQILYNLKSNTMKKQNVVRIYTMGCMLICRTYLSCLLENGTPLSPLLNLKFNTMKNTFVNLLSHNETNYEKHLYLLPLWV